jgi:hypothetical protein
LNLENYLILCYYILFFKQDKLKNKKDELDIKINYIEEEIDIRVESIKNQLTKASETLKLKIREITKELSMCIIYFFDINIGLD